jgi:hypothetical protein
MAKKPTMTRMEQSSLQHAKEELEYQRSPQAATDLAADKARRAALDKKVGATPGQGFDAFTLYGSKGKTVGNNPMPTAGSRQPHGWGHTASQKDGHLRLSGDPKAHRLGKK